MQVRPVSKISDLKKRIGRFLSSSAYGRGEVTDLLRSLEELGAVSLFGGMVRDIGLVGNDGFNSDIDVVVSTDDGEALARILSSYPYSRNKFGGYRVHLSKWELDLWTFSSTWAFEQGLVAGTTLVDLCKTTFFDWDAVLYEVGGGSVIALDGYLERIGSGVVSINLEPNPNPVGNIVKAFRYCEKYGAKFSPPLAAYIETHLADDNAQELCSLERKSHECPVLMEPLASKLLFALREHQQKTPLLPFSPSGYQKLLWPVRKLHQ